MNEVNTTVSAEPESPTVKWNEGAANARRRVGTLTLNVPVAVEVTAEWKADEIQADLDHLGKFSPTRRKGTIDLSKRDDYGSHGTHRFWVPAPGKYDKPYPETVRKHGSVAAARAALIEEDLQDHLAYCRGNKWTWECTVTVRHGSLTATKWETGITDPFPGYNEDVEERLAEEARLELRADVMDRLSVE